MVFRGGNGGVPLQKSNGDSIEFSLSNAEQRDSWLNSSYWTLAADILCPFDSFFQVSFFY